MLRFVERRVSRAAQWSRRLAWFAAMLFLLAGLGHRFGLIETPPFLILLAIVGGLAVAALAAAALGFAQLWRNGDKAGRSALVGVLVALIVLSPFAVSGFLAYTHPRLNDISTDLIDPPALVMAERERTAEMNPIRPPDAKEIELQAEEYPEITGRRYDVSPDRVLTAVLAEVVSRGWRLRGTPVAPETDGDTTVEAVAHTFLLGFKVDVAVRIVDEGASTYVDMRSVSRYGRHDLGDNARRIASFLAALDLAMKEPPVE